MRLAINAGGLDSFFNGLGSFIGIGANTAGSDSLISSFQTMASKTSGVSGGVGTLGVALGYIQTRKIAEETRKTAVMAVKTQTDSFVQTALSVDKAVASAVSTSQEAFYQANPWLRPPVQPSGLARFWEDIKDTASSCWDGLVNFYKEHKKIIDTILIVLGAVLAIAAVVCTGGLALVPLLATGLTALGVSAGVALTIATVTSLVVAGIAITSTFASSILNIIDTWAEIDNPTFNAWQKGLNITSAISNGLYSIGNLYNSIKGVSGKEFIARQRAIENGKLGYSNLDAQHPRMQHKPGADFDDVRKAEIIQENMRRNGGVLRSDQTGKILEPAMQSTRGVTPPINEANIDHIFPRSLGGTNGFANAQVIERAANIAKSGQMTFTEFLKFSVPDKGSLFKALGSVFSGFFNTGVNLGTTGAQHEN